MVGGKHVLLHIISPEDEVVNAVDGLVLFCYSDKANTPDHLMDIAFFNPRKPGTGILDKIDWRLGVKHKNHDDIAAGKELFYYTFPSENIPVYIGDEEDSAYAAAAAHEANRILCAALGDNSQVKWDEAPEWQKLSAQLGASAIIRKPSLLPQESHEGWLAQKMTDGWKYGPVKDADKKEHPSFALYDQLPVPQRLKDYLFGVVVRASLGMAQLQLDIPVPEETSQLSLAVAPVSDEEVYQSVASQIMGGIPLNPPNGANLQQFIEAINRFANEQKAQLDSFERTEAPSPQQEVKADADPQMTSETTDIESPTPTEAATPQPELAIAQA